MASGERVATRVAEARQKRQKAPPGHRKFTRHRRGRFSPTSSSLAKASAEGGGSWRRRSWHELKASSCEGKTGAAQHSTRPMHTGVAAQSKHGDGKHGLRPLDGEHGPQRRRASSRNGGAGAGVTLMSRSSRFERSTLSLVFCRTGNSGSREPLDEVLALSGRPLPPATSKEEGGILSKYRRLSDKGG